MLGKIDAMSNFIQADPNQPLLLPVDDMVYLILEAVELVPMTAFKVNRRGSGGSSVFVKLRGVCQIPQ